jgi:hypothetical protein
MKALKDFDEVAKTDFATEIPASYAREFLQTGNMNVSRNVNFGRSAGRAIGGPVGEVIGGGIGMINDVYAKKIGKTLLDLSMMPGLGSAGKLLHKAALKSPHAGMAMYRFLKTRDAVFSQKTDEFFKDEEEPE